MLLQYQMQIKQALRVEDNRTKQEVSRIIESIGMVRAYIVCNTRNLVGPDRFVTAWFIRISILDEMVEEPQILQSKYWS
jgi:hypothetical protein